jgi:hypothetical protein
MQDSFYVLVSERDTRELVADSKHIVHEQELPRDSPSNLDDVIKRQKLVGNLYGETSIARLVFDFDGQDRTRPLFMCKGEKGLISVASNVIYGAACHTERLGEGEHEVTKAPVFGRSPVVIFDLVYQGGWASEFDRYRSHVHTLSLDEDYNEVTKEFSYRERALASYEGLARVWEHHMANRELFKYDWSLFFNWLKSLPRVGESIPF